MNIHLNKVLFFYLLLMMIFSFCDGFYAQAKGKDFSLWLTDLKKGAVKKGISQKTVDKALDDVKPLPWIIEADRNQPEFKVSLNEYLARAVTEERILQGRKLLKQHHDLLTEIAIKYRVPAHLLVALWAIETNFGRNSGEVPVIPALVTLAFDERRRTYFRAELFQALRILDLKLIPLAQFKGSWAGAIGYLQFMPSVFIENSVDFNQDGQINIWQSGGDLFASAANFLSRSGWQSGQKWGREVKLTNSLDAELMGLKKQSSLTQWKKLGIRREEACPLRF